MGRSRFKAGPGAKRIAGKVCYHGEVWMGGAPGQFRGSGVSSILGRFAFLTALQQWSPDYVFGFMPKPVAHKGFVERQGYMHAEPFALRWFIKGKADPLEGFLAYMSREDLHFVLDMPEADLEAEKASGEALSGRQLADLNNYYMFVLDEGIDAAELIDALNDADQFFHTAGLRGAPLTERL